MSITRIVDTDDDGTGTTGTIRTNAWLQTIYDSLELTWASNSYTPTWGNSGTANTIGSGSIAGAYFRVGKLYLFRIQLVWASGTSSGSGNWTFTMPTTSDGFAVAGGISGWAFDSSLSQYFAVSAVNSSTTVFAAVNDARPATSITATAPFTWATGDTLSMVGWMLAA